MSDPGPASDAFQVQGPDVAIISWIPFAYNLSDMAANEFTRHRRSGAFGWLFDSGNLDPPDNFDGHGEFLDYLATKAFRGACCLRNVRLSCDRDGMPGKLAYDSSEFVGYTPVRFANPVTRRKRSVSHDLGERSRGNDCLNSADDAGATLAQTFAFRVGKLGNWASWIMTTKEAPYVWEGLEYRIEKTGSVQVRFGGSFIPSHRFYVGWKACGGHDMLGIAAAKIEGFLETGRDRFSPGAMLVDWNGEGDSC